MDENALRRVFWVLNKTFMVPAYRLGLGPLINNPFSGYLMVLKTRGRKSGILRYTPVNYAIRDGSVYCVSGFGKISDWYRNIQSDPHVEVMLPGRAYYGECELVTDPQELVQGLRQVLRNAGFAGFLAGYNPFTVSDERLLAEARKTPLVRIRPSGVGSGPADPGGRLWVLATLVGIFWLVRRKLAYNQSRD